MPETPAAPPAGSRWRVLVTPRWLSWHLFAVCAVAGMLWLGDWQFHRAVDGNALSWAYTFEWPIFAVFGVFFWFKTVRDELHPSAPRRRSVELPAAIRSSLAAGDDATELTDQDPDDSPEREPEAVDTELAEYNAYLAKLNGQARSHGR